VRLRDGLEALSPQQRRCLYLRAEGLRYHEIAETLGVSLSTVAEYVSRGIARLRKAVHG
jgi:RNA polymerase sigma-70 factor (ECF subfamily)